MSNIVAAIVDSQDQAAQLREVLLQQGFVSDRIDVFFVNPAGQHDMTPIGGDQHTDPHASRMPDGAGRGAVLGATAGTALGAVVGVLVPPLAPITLAGGAGVGAYAGALAGALSAGGKQADDLQQESASAVSPEPPPRTRRSGMMVAVCTDQTPTAMPTATPAAHAAAAAPASSQDDRSARLADLLRAHGAEHVEQAEGQWADGHWADFDPSRLPRTISVRTGARIADHGATPTDDTATDDTVADDKAADPATGRDSA